MPARSALSAIPAIMTRQPMPPGWAEVAVIETSVSICDQANIDTVLPEARRNNVGVLAKRPIANAAWKDASEQRGVYVDYAKTYSDRLTKIGDRAGGPGVPG